MRDWLKKARDKKGFTMKQAAEQLKISESYYSLIENEERQKSMDFSLAKKISEVFGIPVIEIYENENGSG